jgi:flavin reductase (DIM6/NTAB) family NADH-FMN oxidoreductase RutF
MFYRPEDGHGLPHNPFSAIIAPRPIGWISSRGPEGDNLAPYSFFNAVAYEPPQVMFASTGVKDSLVNIRESGVFAVNIVAYAQRDEMNRTSASVAHGVDEFAYAGIDKAECASINCPRVAESPATLECVLTEIIALKGGKSHVVFGEVTGVHIRDEYLREGRLELALFEPLARLGYRDYARISEPFELKRPDDL